MNKRTGTYMSTAIVVLLIAGCATNRTDAVKQGLVKVELLPNNPYLLHQPSIWLEDGRLIIYGEVVRPWGMRGAIPGHIDVVIRSPDGTVIHEGPVQWLPRTVRSRRFGARRYLLNVTVQPLGREVVTIVHHSDPPSG